MKKAKKTLTDQKPSHFASFILDNSEMMPMMHENARFEILSLFW
jgi:hypothetical protein